VEWHRDDGHLISDDAARLDVARVARWLREDAYWALGRTQETVERSIMHSVNLGLYRPDGEQVGFCRWVTDRATFAWLCDVYLAPPARGDGLGTWLIATAVGHPAVRGVRRQLLATLDAHGLYARFDFTPLAEPARWMERRRA
jgi:GNAT superfamily N-acetyltransferase